MTLCLVPPIHRTTHTIGLYLADLRDLALSQGEAHVLAQLATAAPATIGALHRGLAHKRSTLTSILDRLVQRGYITRHVGESDRRTFVIDTTSEGKRAARRVHRHLTALEDAVNHRVTGREVRAFLKVLSAMEEQARQSSIRARRSRR